MTVKMFLKTVILFLSEKRSPQEPWSVTQLQFQKADVNTQQPLIVWQPENVTTQGYVAKFLDFTQQQKNTKLLQNFNNNEQVSNYTDRVLTSSFPDNNPANERDTGDYEPLPHRQWGRHPPPYWGYPPPPWWRRHPSYYHIYWDYYRRPPQLPGNQDERRSTDESEGYNQNNSNSYYDRDPALQGGPPSPLWGPPPYRRWGPPPYRPWGPSPYRRWGPPPYRRWDPPPYQRWGSAPSHQNWGPPPPHHGWGPPPSHHDWGPPPPHHGWGPPPPQQNWDSPRPERPVPEDNQQPTQPPYENNQIQSANNRASEQSQNPSYDNFYATSETALLKDIRKINRPGHGVPLVNDERVSENRPEATTQSFSHLFQAMPVRPES